jgi:hypothetical protein
MGVKRSLLLARLWSFGVNISAVGKYDMSDEELPELVNKLTLLMKKYRVQAIPSFFSTRASSFLITLAISRAME